jgi:hypothetical protein
MQGEQSPYFKLSGGWCSTLVGDMTTIKYRVTSMKEEELHSVSVIEPLSVSDEVVAMMK